MVSATWHVTTDSAAPYTFTAEFAQAYDQSVDITKDDDYYISPSMTESGQTIYDITVSSRYDACLKDPLLVTRGTAAGAGSPMTSSGVTKKSGPCVT